MKFRNFRGFTLIELLIVVAIIAILAAIAVPNFLEAQVRAKATRCKNDMRSLATALESYRMDNPGYPPDRIFYDFFGPIPGRPPEPKPLLYYMLSTPVAYITKVPEDVFPNTNWGKNQPPYFFAYAAKETKELQLGLNPQPWKRDMGRAWILVSYGPDRKASECASLLYTDEDQINKTVNAWPNGPVFYGAVYDATNGTISNGDIVRFGP